MIEAKTIDKAIVLAKKELNVFVVIDFLSEFELLCQNIGIKDSNSTCKM